MFILQHFEHINSIDGNYENGFHNSTPSAFRGGFTPSSQANPCPVCGRTKDGDCRISQDGNLVLCHHNFGDICPNGWLYVKPSNDDRTGVFVRDYPKTDRPWGQTFKHSYRSFQGTTHTQVRKYKPDKTGKTCRWDKPLGEIKEVDLLPYQWDKVKGSPEIFLVEGELCVDDLIGRGLPATCVRSWGDNHAELFAGKTVILLPDCDREGIKKAGKARDLLTAHNATIRWCYLPRIGNWEYPKPKDGLDSFDYFQLGGTEEELRSAITENEIVPKAKPKSTDTDGEGKAKPKKMTPGDFILEHWGDRLRWNELLLQVELDGEALQDIELLYADVLLEYGYKFPKVLFGDTIVCIAKKNSYHPVREYLESVKDAPPIDISNLSKRYFGTTNPLYDLYLKKTLIAAVARIFEPGCKHDSALILQGKQGIGKSTFFSILGGAFFADGLGDVRDGKDELLLLHRAWLHEWAELETLLGSRASGSIKAFLSRSSDLFRVPYGRATQEFKRSCVITGTTNHEEFLNDPTGSRRFWVIPVQTDRIDTEALKAERDAIWAGAIRAYLAGESWWLTQDEAAQSTELNQDYQVRDVWENPITRYLETVKETSIDEILAKVLDKPIGQATKADQMRVGAILTRLGWERRRVQRSGSRTYLYFPALPALPCPTLKTEVGHTSNPDSTSITEPVPYLPYLFSEKNIFNGVDSPVSDGVDSTSSAVGENKKSTLLPSEGRAGRAEAQNTVGESVTDVPYLENEVGQGRAGRADTPPTTPLNGVGNREISVGDRVRYVSGVHWNVCRDYVLTVKSIDEGNAIVTCHKWERDKTIPIDDLELVLGKNYSEFVVSKN